MRAMFGAAVAALVSGCPALAAEPSVGRWAMEPAVCSAWSGNTPATAPLVVYDNSLNWFSGGCRFGKIYKAGPALYIQAHCETGGDVAVTLDARGDRMMVSWNRDRPQTLRRCP